jgi:hypothetical protein
MSRIEKIIHALVSQGRMTAKRASEVTGIDFREACKLITQHRKEHATPSIRRCGKLREGNRRASNVYEVSDEIDADDSFILPSINAFIDIDELDRRRIARLAAQIKPFRDPMVFRTAGRAP